MSLWRELNISKHVKGFNLTLSFGNSSISMVINVPYYDKTIQNKSRNESHRLWESPEIQILTIRGKRKILGN